MKAMRQDFREHAAQWVCRRLKFLDESGLYLGMTRRYGWATRGQRVHDAVPVNYGTPWTVVATISFDGVQAPWLLEGAMNADAFNTYVTEVLCPILQPGDIVVMDNLSAHKQVTIRQSIEVCGAHVEFLPPYSPDFNPIELCWAKVKQALRSARAKTAGELLTALAEALRSVSIADITNWLRHCGYALS